MKKLLTIWLVMLLTAALVGSSPSKGQAATTATKESGTTAETKKAPAKELLDINSASTDELKSLGGIDDATAKKIVENRPYERKDQLVSKKIISRQTYVRIKDQIIAKQAKQTKTK
jgi:competence protein ComEA